MSASALVETCFGESLSKAKICTPLPELPEQKALGCCVALGQAEECTYLRINKGLSHSECLSLRVAALTLTSDITMMKVLALSLVLPLLIQGLKVNF